MRYFSEIESAGKISFLDVLIERKSKGYETEVFRKSTDTGLYNNPMSFCDPKYNKNMVKGLIHRIWNLSYTYFGVNKGIVNLKSRLENNGYNKNYLNNLIKNTIDSIREKSNNKNENIINNDSSNVIKTINLKLPFSEGASDLRKGLMKKVPSGFNLRVIFITNKLSRYFSNKSKTPSGVQANLVYQFKCHKCESLYIGETNRHLRTRIAEHTQLSRNSSILDHIKKCRNRDKVNYETEFTVLKKNFDTYHERIVTEALLIKHLKPCLNVQSELSNHIKIF